MLLLILILGQELANVFPFLMLIFVNIIEKNASTNFKFAKAITIFLKNNGKIRENYVHKMCGPHPEKS